MPAEKTSFTATEIKAGVMVLASVVILAAFVAAIRGCGAGGETMNTYSTVFRTIEGLNLGAEVRFGGVKAGKVLEISTDPTSREMIRVRFEVPADVPVNYGSIASIEQISLTTGKHLEISTGSEDEPLHEDGDEITASTTEGGAFGIPDLSGVVARLETVLDGLITLLGVERARADAELGGDGVVDLAAVTAALREALGAGTTTLQSLNATIEENRDGLGQIVERLVALEEAANTLLTNLNAAVEENRPPLNRTLTNFEELSETAARRVEELTDSLALTLDYLEEISGNTSDLMESRRPTLEQILLNLEATTRSLKHFAQSLEEQPNALIRGVQPQGRPDGGTK